MPAEALVPAFGFGFRERARVAAFRRRRGPRRSGTVERKRRHVWPAGRPRLRPRRIPRGHLPHQKGNDAKRNASKKVRRRFGDDAAVVADEIVGRETSETWGKGSAGESKLAAFVAREVGDSVIALHDRLIPGTKGNIDHIFITSMGVWVVDAK